MERDIMKCKKNCGRNTQYGNEYCEKCMDEMIDEEKQLAGLKPKTSRKVILMDFYYRMKKQLEGQDFDFIVFCQCYDALTKRENFNLEEIYLTDFNNALVRYANKPSFQTDIKSKERNRRMLHELGWKEVKIC